MVEIQIDLPALLSPLAKKAIKDEINSRLSLLKEVNSMATTSDLKKALVVESKALRAQLEHFTGEAVANG